MSSAHMLLKLLLSDPGNLRKHIMNASANVILGISYGYTVQSGHDPLVELAEETTMKATDGFQLKYLVNVLPIC